VRHAPFPIDCSDTACPLYGRRDCVPAELACHHEDEVCDLLFIGEAPGKTEVDKRRPFVGESGRLLRKAIKEASPGPVNVAYSNVARCLPLNEAGDIRKPVAAEVKACQHFLMADIERLDPDVICLLGASAIELFLPDRPTVHAERGRWRRVHIAGRDRIVMTTWHPAYVLRQFSALPMWFTDLQLCLRMGAGWRPRPEWGAVGQSRCLKTVEEVADLVEMMLSLDQSHYVALDVETRNLNKRYGNRLGMLQFSWDGTAAHCVPLDHPQTPFDDAGLRAVRKLMRRLFTRTPRFRGWLTHFGKFEQTQIGQHVLDRGDGVARTFSNAPMLDTGAFAYLLNENATAAKGAAYTLKFLARQYLGFFHYDDTTLMARAGGQLLDLPLDCAVPIGQDGWEPNLTDYGGMDAYVTWRLFWALQEEAAVQRYRGKALKLLEHLFGPTFTLLSQIERNGFWGNLAHLKMLQDPERSPIVSRLLEIDNKALPAIPSAQRANDKLVLAKSHGSPPVFDTPWILDLNKDAHVRAWLVDELELEPLERGKTGVASVGKMFFQHYSDVDEVKLVEERRGLAKLQSAYIKQLIEYIDPRYATEDCQDGRVRCDLFFTTTVSGRGSASNPNMQQQVRGDSPAKAAIKNIWQAEQPGVQRSFRVDFTKGPPDLSARALERVPTNCLVQLDFVTAEVKWWALLSGCPALSQALLKGYRMRQEYRADPRPELKEKAAIEGDLHKNTASLMYETPVANVDKAMRTAAKSIVFGAMYGRGVKALAAQIKKDEDEAQALLDKFSGAFPVGWDWLQRCPIIAGENWYIESPIGRRRRLPSYLLWSHNMNWDERRVVSECDRMAKNSPIQGISSDASFLGAALFAQHIEQHGLSWKVQNVVHDSCVYQVPIAELRESIAVAERCFTTDTMQVLTDVWGMRFTCPIEIDFEFGLAWGGLTKWDFTDAEFERLRGEMLCQIV
jgi:uracil-DNA glycosylase family 4